MKSTSLRQEIAQHIRNRKEIKKLYQQKGIQMLQKNQLIFQEINEQTLEMEKEFLYKLMKDELMQYGYSEFRYINEGSQGYVVLAKERFTNKRFAIKGIAITDLNGIIDQNKLNQANQEKKILEQIRGSPYVANLIKTIKGIKFIFFVLTECQGTLKELIDSIKGNKLNELSAIKYCKDIAEGLNYIHSQKNIIINDLKFDNILIDYNGNAVISDFGFGQTLATISGYSEDQYMGNFYFQAPECYDPKSFNYVNEYIKRNIQTQTTPSKRSDACSLGYLLYVMIQGYYPQLTFKKHLELPFDYYFQTFKYKKQLFYIINGLTQFVPRERLEVEEVLILLKGIISLEFDLDSKFIEIISKEAQEEAKKLNQQIEFIQLLDDKYYPIFKNEGSVLQELQGQDEEIEKPSLYSQKYQNQINYFIPHQVQAEQKIKEKEKIIKDQEAKIAQLTYENSLQVQAQEKIKVQEKLIKEQEAKIASLTLGFNLNQQNQNQTKNEAGQMSGDTFKQQQNTQQFGFGIQHLDPQKQELIIQIIIGILIVYFLGGLAFGIGLFVAAYFLIYQQMKLNENGQTETQKQSQHQFNCGCELCKKKKKW